MLKRLNINLALYHKPAFFIQIPRALHKHYHRSHLIHFFISLDSTLSSLQWMVKACAEASDAAFCANPANETHSTQGKLTEYNGKLKGESFLHSEACSFALLFL